MPETLGLNDEVATTAVGPAIRVLFALVGAKEIELEEAEVEDEEDADTVVEEKVEVTDATISETVMVRVMVAVDVSVRVEEELSAMASRGSRRAVVSFEMCIFVDGSWVSPGWRGEMRQDIGGWEEDAMRLDRNGRNDRYIASVEG